MKTRIFLPVFTMLSLMLLSFTTNSEGKDNESIEVSENGTYYMQRATFDESDQEQLIQLDKFFVNNANSAELRLTISRVRTWNHKDFTERSFIVADRYNPSVLEKDIVREYREKLDNIMFRYVRQ